MSVLADFYAGWQARLIWVACAIYLVCAVLRLARFNLHNVHDEEHHRYFTGLPSPSAAGVIASFVILHTGLMLDYQFVWVGRLVLPVLLLVVGPLMVSKVRYVHLVHELTRGERSFPFLITLVFGIFLVVVLREFIIPVIFTTYLMSGIVGVAIDRLLDRIDLAQNRDSFFR
jgi:CDP-diacylglycerol--serine O-phosphatidyltransferase